MNDPFAEYVFEETRARSRARDRRAGMLRAHRREAEDGFTCRDCGRFVSSAAGLAGVQNRNHCPYCLSSRHLDLYEPGDRLSACKAIMRPVALALKQVRKKYGRPGQGELMLVHACIDCGRVSINRLAADDDPDRVLAVFSNSLRLDPRLAARLADQQIFPLEAESRNLVETRLWGRV